MKQKGLVLALILILAALATVGYFGYKNYRPITENLIPTLSPTPTPDSIDTTNSKVSECLASTTCKGDAPCTTNPASVFCICMGGEEIIVNNEGGQSGVCKINGKEYDEWE